MKTYTNANTSAIFKLINNEGESICKLTNLKSNSYN